MAGDALSGDGLVGSRASGTGNQGNTTAAVIVSRAVGFVVATLNQPDTATAGAYAASSDAKIVSQLKTLNRGVASLNRAIRASYKRSSLIGETANGLFKVHADLDDVDSSLARMCRAISDKSYECPSLPLL